MRPWVWDSINALFPTSSRKCPWQEDAFYDEVHVSRACFLATAELSQRITNEKKKSFVLFLHGLRLCVCAPLEWMLLQCRGLKGGAGSLVVSVLVFVVLAFFRGRANPVFPEWRRAFERCKNKEQGNAEISPMVLHGVKIAMPSLEGEAGW